MNFFNDSLIGKAISFKRGFLVATLFSYYIASEAMVFIIRNGMKALIYEKNKSNNDISDLAWLEFLYIDMCFL